MPPRKTTARRTKSDEDVPAPRKMTTVRVEELSDTNEYKKILLVGDSGVGKTVLAGGAPKGIFLSTEKGTISAKRFGSKAKLIRVSDWKQLEQALDYVEENASEYVWLMVDSLPKMQRMLRRHILDANVEEGRKGADPDSLQIQDYDKWYNMFTRFYDRLNEMPINVIYTSTPMRVETEDDEGEPIDQILPAIQGKAKEGYSIAQYICAEVDCLWFLNIERRSGKQQRILITQKRPPFFAKDRYAALPARVVLPDNDPSLTERILGTLDSGDSASVPEDEPEEDLEEEPRSTRRTKKPEPETEPEDEEDEEPAPRRRAPARKTASKRPTAREKASRAKKPEPEDDDDLDLDADPDDDDDYSND